MKSKNLDPGPRCLRHHVAGVLRTNYKMEQKKTSNQAPASYDIVYQVCWARTAKSRKKQIRNKMNH